MSDASTEKLEALLARVEAATGPDREIDAQLWLLVHYPEYQFPDKVLNRRPASYSEAAGRFNNDGYGDELPRPAYTSSLDAIVALIERELPGTMWATGNMEEGPFGRLLVPQSDGGYAGGYVNANGASEPLALCAAFLRAQLSSPHSSEPWEKQL